MTTQPPAAAAESGERPQGGRLNAAISNRVVQITRDYIGRGPTKARTYLNGSVVVVVLEDALTKAERSLARAGKEQLVLQVRHEFQRTMRDDLTASIQELTGRGVVAFMSDNHVEPDMAVEIFVLDGDVFAHGDGDEPDVA